MNRYDDGELVSKIIRRISLEGSMQARPASPASRCIEKSMKMWNEYSQLDTKRLERRLSKPRSISEASTVPFQKKRRNSIFDKSRKLINEDQKMTSTKSTSATSGRTIKKMNSDEGAKTASSSNSLVDKSTGNAHDDVNRVIMSPREDGTCINSDSKSVGSTTDKRNKRPVSSAAMGPVDVSKERPSGGSSKRETRRHKKASVAPIGTNGSRRARQNSGRSASSDVDQPPASPLSAHEGDTMFGADEKTKPKPRPLSPFSRAVDALGAEEKTKPRIRSLSPVPHAIESSPITSTPKQIDKEVDQSPDPKRPPGASPIRDTRRRQVLDSKHKKRPVTPIAVPGTRLLPRTSSSNGDGDADVLVPPTSPTSKRELLLPRHSSEDRLRFKKRIMGTPPRSLESSPVVTPKYVPVEQTSDLLLAPSAANKRPVSSVTRAVDNSPPPTSFKAATLSSQSTSSTSLPRVTSVPKLSPKGASSSRRGRKFKRPYDFMSTPATPVMERRRDLGRLVKTAPVPDAVRRSRLLQPRYRCRSSRTVRKRLRNPMALASAGAPKWLTKLAIDKSFSGPAKNGSGELGQVITKSNGLALKSGDRISDRPSTNEPPSLRMFEVVGCLGKGAFGKVLLVTKRPKKREGPRHHSVFGRDARARKKFAMKVVCKAKMARKDMFADVAAERKILQHRNKYMVRLRYAFQTETHIFLVLNYVAGGSLDFHLQRKSRFPEHWVQLYAAELFVAIESLHSRSILHRDIKPENIMIRADGHLQLADFGFSTSCAPNMLVSSSDRVGSPVYMSPEMISGKQYGSSVDWWAYGIVVYQMSQGLPPFTGASLKDCFTAILRAQVEFVHRCSDAYKQFTCKLLEPNLAARLGCGPKGLAEIRQHPFLSKGNWSWNQLRERKVHAPFLPGEVTIVKTDDVEIDSPDDSDWSKSLTHKHKKDLLAFSQNFRDYSYERAKSQKNSAKTTSGRRRAAEADAVSASVSASGVGQEGEGSEGETPRGDGKESDGRGMLQDNGASVSD